MSFALLLLTLACAQPVAPVATSLPPPAATEARAPSPTPATPTPALERGPLIWQATLDADGTDLDLASRYVMGDPAAAAIRAVAGGIEVAIIRTGGPTGASFKRSLPPRFVAEMDFRVAPGSDMQFVWRVRSGDQLHLVKVDTLREAVEFVYADPNDWPTRLQSLTAPLPIPGLLSGRAVTVTVVAEPPRYLLYLDGERVAEINDPRLTARAAPLAFGGFGERGRVTIVGLRAYELPSR
jgi:hypothetical protein